MPDWQTRSFWLGRAEYHPTERLDGSTSADVVIVGAGYTGLWTAIQLKDADPAIDVVVLENKVAGYGASGRNGGFAMTMVARNIHDLARKVGVDSARATHLAMVDTLGEMLDFCTKENINADVVNCGLLTVSNGPEQDVRIRQDLAAAERLGLTDFHEISRDECRALVNTDSVRFGHWEDHALLVDPAALVRGLRDAALRRGVRLYEMTPVDEVAPKAGRVEARTPYGVVHADRALIATNAYAYSIPRIRRFIFTIYAYITLTEQLTDEQWASVGWDRRMGIEDKRIMVHFFRPTADGRILWGGRDAPFIAGGPNPRYDRNPYIFGRLEETFRWTFPQLADVRMEHAWAGPVCGTIDCIASVGWLSGERIAYALGYSGHGVGPSHLVGKIVRDLLLGSRSGLLELPFVTRRPKPLPPGPLRPLLLNTAQRVLLHADDVGDDGNLLVRGALRILQ